MCSVFLRSDHDLAVYYLFFFLFMSLKVVKARSSNVIYTQSQCEWKYVQYVIWWYNHFKSSCSISYILFIQGKQQRQFKIRVDLVFNRKFSLMLLPVIAEGFYFEHVERRSCFSVPLSDLTAVAEGAEGEQAEEKQRQWFTFWNKQEAGLSSCPPARSVSCVGRQPGGGVVCHGLFFPIWNYSVVKTSRQH